jgi:hypothetical protein
MMRMLVLLVGLGVLGAGAWFVVAQAPVPRAVVGSGQAPRPATFSQPAASGLQTPFGDAMFRWRCTTGLRDALGDRLDWPMRRVAGFCLCVADRMREDGLRDVPRFSGDGLAAALETAEAQLCRRP